MSDYIVTHSLTHSKQTLTITHGTDNICIIVPSLQLSGEFMDSSNYKIVNGIEIELYGYLRYFITHDKKYESASGITHLLTRIFQYNYLELCVGDMHKSTDEQYKKFNNIRARIIDFTAVLHAAKKKTM